MEVLREGEQGGAGDVRAPYGTPDARARRRFATLARGQEERPARRRPGCRYDADDAAHVVPRARADAATTATTPARA